MNADPTLPIPPAGAELADFAEALVASRQTVLPKRLEAPGPTPAQLARIVAAAAAAPDHRELLPWRFVVVPAAKRAALGEAFAQALVERDASATPEQQAQAREKAERAPLVMLAVLRVAPDEPEIGPFERAVSLGAAIQNMLLVAHAMGFGAGLTSGRALAAAPLRRLFGLADGEEAVCFVNVGTATKRKPTRRRPDPSRYLSTL